MYIYIYVCVYVYTYIYIYIHIHTQIQCHAIDVRGVFPWSFSPSFSACSGHGDEAKVKASRIHMVTFWEQNLVLIVFICIFMFPLQVMMAYCGKLNTNCVVRCRAIIQICEYFSK